MLTDRLILLRYRPKRRQRGVGKWEKNNNSSTLQVQIVYCQCPQSAVYRYRSTRINKNS